MLDQIALGRTRVFATMPERAPSARTTVAGLSLVMLLSSLGTSIANVALPTLAVAFNASFHEVQWVVLAYLLSVTTAIVSVGRLGDVMGRRRLMMLGLSLFTLASGLCGLSPTLSLLIAARAVQGLAAAIMMALTLALVGDAVPKEKSGSAMGLLGTMSAIGTALGPSLGGLLIASFGWPSIFLINVPLGLIALLLAYEGLPQGRPTPTSDRKAFDPLGTLGILRDPLLRSRLVINGLVSTVAMATLVVGPFYLSGALELGAAQVGLVMSAGPLVAALTGVPAGRMVDRFGAKRMTIVGLVTIAIGASILPMLPTRFGVPGYVTPLIVLTAGYAVFQAANGTAVMANASPSQRGAISGMLNLSRNLGLITGASIMGAVFAFTSGASVAGEARPAAVAVGMRATFAVAAVLVFAALAIAKAADKRSQG